MRERSLFATEKERRARSRSAWLRALELTAPIGRDAVPILPALIEDLAERYGNAPALITEAETWSYRVLAGRMNDYARWAVAQGVTNGEIVALIAPNGPEYLAIWLGLTRVGAIVALVNTNLSGDALLQSITAVDARHLIATDAFCQRIAPLQPFLPATSRCWVIGASSEGFARIDLQATDASVENRVNSEPALGDRALYLYTSGTEGVSKAAAVTHRRLLEWSLWFAGMMNTGPNDRLYNCLPMYHAIGGIVGTGAILVNGGSIVLRERFSAQAFWSEIAHWQCTIFLYIGELCRYLVTRAADPDENRHRLRLCCGNGLRGDIWERFEARFGVTQILEFYAATEGAVALYNCEGKKGAIGRIPPFLPYHRAVALIRVDADTRAPLRDADGLCIHAEVNEVGEAIGAMTELGLGGGGRFDGYTDRSAWATKFLHDVFAPGDAWFRSGDLMTKDEEGFFHFVDRLGDTYRWKGENVSTSEVAAVIASLDGISEAFVYGVAVPGTEGRAGMAAIIPRTVLDLALLWRHISLRLPAYAQPVFLRVTGSIPKTATLRPQKQSFARDGFEPGATRDPVYLNDRALQTFVPIDPALHARILAGQIRL
jgi:fatty-acyl-CoA synthase